MSPNDEVVFPLSDQYPPSSQVLSGSQTGRKHPENQDAFGHRQLLDGSILLVVADGISSSPFGGSIARLLVQEILSNDEFRPKDAPIDHLRSHLAELHNRLREEYEDYAEMLESGVSLAIAVVTTNRVYCIWAGDSLIVHTKLDEDPSTRLLIKPDSGNGHSITNCFMAGRDLRLNTSSAALSHEDVITLMSDGVIADEAALTAGYSEQGFCIDFITELLNTSTKSKTSDDATIVAYQHIQR